MTDDPEPPPGWWAVVELTDHRKVAGLLSEQVVAGTSFLRIDVPAAEGRRPSAQLYAPHAIYSITPVDEPAALRAAGRTQQAFGDVGVAPVAEPGDGPVPVDATAGEPAARGPAPDGAVPDGATLNRAASAERELLTVSELASRYACSRSTVMRWQTFGDFPEPAVRGPRRLAVYELADIEHFLARHPELLRTYHRG